MEISVADQRILLFAAAVSAEESKKKAHEKKLSAFGAISQVTSLFSRPKEDEFELLYEEFRFQPFWHVAARAKYVYDRAGGYQVPVSGDEVQSVTYEKTTFAVTNRHFHIPVTEHCVQEEADEVFVEGVGGKPDVRLKEYLARSAAPVSGAIEKAVPKGAIIVPPQSRVSAIMRDSLSKMIKGIQADTISEERVEVTCVDLYYHPVYAFQYRWKPKNKDAILEVDGMTGTVTTGNRVFSEYMGKVLDPSFLFDIGADAAGVLIPGGSIAVKVAKKYIESKKK